MTQIPISPFDNDRLKTRKVRQMLDDLGVLPATHDQRPSFLRSHVTVATLIDRALAGVADDPNLRQHCSRNSGDFAAAINSKFAAAFLVDDGGAGLPAGALGYADFKNGTYFYGGNALSDFLVEDAVNWNSFNPASVIMGQGYVAPGGNEGPVLAPALTDQLITAMGFTAVCDVILTLDESGNYAGIAINMMDFPAQTQDIYVAVNASPSAVQLGDYNNIVTLPAVSSGDLHRIAVTLSSTHLGLSIDGGAVITYDVTDPFICNAIPIALNHGVWEKLVLYPIKTDVELPALSTLA